MCDCVQLQLCRHRQTGLTLKLGLDPRWRICSALPPQEQRAPYRKTGSLPLCFKMAPLPRKSNLSGHFSHISVTKCAFYAESAFTLLIFTFNFLHVSFCNQTTSTCFVLCLYQNIRLDQDHLQLLEQFSFSY